MVTRRSVISSSLPMAAAGVTALSPARSFAANIIHEYHKPEPVKDADHQRVFYRDDRFSAWTYTTGFWECGNGDLLQNFTSLTVDYSKLDEQGITHNFIFRNATNSELLTIRSKDRGRTWNADNADVNLIARTSENMPTFEESGPIDWLDRSNLLYSPFGGRNVQVSKDNGYTWSKPSQLPLDQGLKQLTSLSSYCVRPDGRCLHFMYETDGGWDRRPLVYGSLDGGTEFHFMTFITPEHDPFNNASGEYETTAAYGGQRWFYPRPLMLDNGRILVSLRCQRDPQGVMWSEVYHSDDGGRTWGFLSRINDFGSPTSMVKMSDGRICAVYGYRLPNQGIRCAVSEDSGKTWGPEQIIRDDGGSWDLGYPNAWEVEPGKIGCIYYFNSKHDEFQLTGGRRHIARSIFSV